MGSDKSSFLVFVALSVSGSFIGACGDGEITAQERSYDGEPAPDPLDIDELPPGTDWWDWVEKPDESNTGPSDPGAIRNIGSCPNITTNGTTLEDFECSGSLRVNANNVTLRNFIINTGSAYYAVDVSSTRSGLLMEYGEMSGGSSNCAALIRGMGFTGRYLHLYSCDDGLKPDDRGDGFASGPAVLLNSYVHGLVGGHGDTVQTWGLGGQTLLFQYNTLIGGNTSVFIIHESPNEPDGFMITNNWLTGGGWTIYCMPNVTVANNLFGRDYTFGPGADRGCNWYGNLYWDNFSVVPYR